MVKFITKSVCIALITVLCVGVNAQTLSVTKQEVQKDLTSARKAGSGYVPSLFRVAQAQHAPTTRDVIFSEGFEGTTLPNLPSGWTVSTAGKWKTMDNFMNDPALGDDFPPHTGTRMMGDVWNTAGNNWAFSPGFSLEGGSSYTVSFWYSDMGYEPYYEADNFEVKIGDAPNAGAMSELIFTQGNIVQGFEFIWKQATKTFTPATSGTYHLGFHDLRPAGDYGLCIAIDDILVEGSGTGPSDCDPAKNLAVKYVDGCSKAELTWSDPSKGRSVVLWDNTDINYTTGGLISTYWSGNAQGVFTADDFDADGVWTIEKVYSKGFSNAPAVLPTKMSVGIYTDASGKPGTEIYRQNDITVTDGAEPEIVLPTPFTLPGAGKYWIAVSGTYDVTITSSQIDSYRWNVYYGSTKIGANYHLQDQTGWFGIGTGWTDASTLVAGSYSMYFKIEGTKDVSSTFEFNIYRDDALIKANHNTTAYTDTGFDETVEHTWDVKVVCSGGSESDPVSKTLDACNPINDDCNPAEITAVTKVGTDGLKIDWTYPVKRAETIITQGGEFNGNGVGAGTSSFGVYHRFTPQDLAVVNGGELKQVIFAPMYGSTQSEPGHTYSIRIYKGGTWEPTRNPGTQILSQDLDNALLDFYSGENTITLTTPIIIDASQELWIGYHCTNIASVPDPQKFPAGTDDGPRKEGLGNVISLGGWRTLWEASDASLNYNWVIKGVVQYTPPTVDIYRNDNKIKSNYEGTSLTDKPLDPGEYCYYLILNCTNGNVSEKSNVECGEIDTPPAVNELSNNIAIFPNPSNSTVTISAPNFAKVEVYNTVGQLVETRTVNTVDVSSYNTGVYFFKVYDSYNNNVTKRVMVTK